MTDVYSCHAILTTPVAHAFVRKRLCARSQPRGHWINKSQSQKGLCLFPPFSISVWCRLSFSSRSLLPTDSSVEMMSLFQCYLTNWYRFADTIFGISSLRWFNGRCPPMTSDGIKWFASVFKYWLEFFYKSFYFFCLHFIFIYVKNHILTSIRGAKNVETILLRCSISGFLFMI